MAKPQNAPEPKILRQIKVKLLPPEQRERFDQLLEEECYLQSARLGGQSLRYVAEVDRQWVALLAFSAPALNIKAREKRIGWTCR